MPSFPKLRGPLTDSAVSVRYAAERDIPEVLIAYQDDPELHLRMGEERPPTGAELGRRAERAESDRIAGRGVTLTILKRGEGTCGGQVEVHRVDWDNARAELGVWVAPQRRGRGLARRALVLVTRWLITECGLARVQILTEPGNARMIGAARAAGFTYEGVLRGYTRGARGRIDMAVLAFIRGDLTRSG
jgi:RimJ/RimL family protein N-acetyltransferase